MKHSPYTNIGIFISFLIIMMNNSCTKHKVWNESPLIYPQNSQTATSFGSVTFWVSNVYDDNDMYWFYQNGFINVTVENVTQTLSYTLKPGSSPACNSDKGVTFNVTTGVIKWKAVRISDGGLIKEGSITIYAGQCVVHQIIL